MSTRSSRSAAGSSNTHPDAVARIAVGLDGYREGRDAAVLAATIARATGAELMLVAVHPDPLVVLPSELGWTGMHEQAEALLLQTRDALAPRARIDVETDWSVPRALERVVVREHRDLLVVGSSRRGPMRRVRISRRTRQLLYDGKCALAVAPRGLSETTDFRLRTVRGSDSTMVPNPSRRWRSREPSRSWPARGCSCGGVVDDRLPAVGWSESGREHVRAIWDKWLGPAVDALRANAEAAVRATGADAEVQVLPGNPAHVLEELATHVDLLVIGSRRWGSTARVLLGSIGETLTHDASCPILVVPRPHS